MNKKLIEEKKHDTEMARLIKDVRDKERLTAEELGRRLGLTQNYMTRLENGLIKNPSFAAVSLIAQAISETKAIRDMEINLQDYRTPFSMLVQSYSKDKLNDIMYNPLTAEQETELAPNDLNELEDSELKLIRSYMQYKKFTKAVEPFLKRIRKYDFSSNGFAYDISNLYIQLLDSSDEVEHNLNELYKEICNSDDPSVAYKLLIYLLNIMELWLVSPYSKKPRRRRTVMKEGDQ